MAALAVYNSLMIDLVDLFSLETLKISQRSLTQPNVAIEIIYKRAYSFLFNLYYKSIVPIHENSGVNNKGTLKICSCWKNNFFLIAAG